MSVHASMLYDEWRNKDSTAIAMMVALCHDKFTGEAVVGPGESEKVTCPRCIQLVARLTAARLSNRAEQIREDVSEAVMQAMAYSPGRLAPDALTKVLQEKLNEALAESKVEGVSIETTLTRSGKIDVKITMPSDEGGVCVQFEVSP